MTVELLLRLRIEASDAVSMPVVAMAPVPVVVAVAAAALLDANVLLVVVANHKSSAIPACIIIILLLISSASLRFCLGTQVIDRGVKRSLDEGRRNARGLVDAKLAEASYPDE